MSETKKKKRWVSLMVCGLIVMLSAWELSSGSDDRAIRRLDNQDFSRSPRVALVIGNADYPEAPLKNQVNDANDIAEILKSLGFEVLLYVNLNKEEMVNAVRKFGDRLSKESVGLFFYSGHGIRVGGVNYLLPVRENIQREDEVAFWSIPADLVLSKMTSAGNPLNLLYLDACRNNPYAKSWNKSAKYLGFSGMNMAPPDGTMIFTRPKPMKSPKTATGVTVHLPKA